MTNISKLLPIVLVALILISAVQAYQLNSLKEKLNSGKVTVAKSTNTGSSAVSGGSGEASQGTSISDLPAMVGGC